MNGFIFSHFIQSDLLSGRDHLQSLAFFLVLLTAGFAARFKATANSLSRLESFKT